MKHALSVFVALSVAITPIIGAADSASAQSGRGRPLTVEDIDRALESPPSARLPTPAEHYQTLRQMFLRPGAGCRVSTITTYNMRGFWYPATVQVCANSVQDISAGPYAAAPGERLFFSNGRARRGSLYSLTRGRPNAPYEFTRDDNDENGYMTYGGGQQTLWSNVSSTLPFVPFSVATYEQNGFTRYAYADLRIPRGLEASAYPLNANSIILSVDGFIFSAPDALAALLSYDNSDTPYLEVFYIQRNESPQRMRRAFLPRLSLAAAGPDWRALASSTNVGRRDNSGQILAFMGVLAIAAALWHLDRATGFSEMIRRQEQECRARAIPGIVC